MDDTELYKWKSKYYQSSVKHLNREMTLTSSHTEKESFLINQW